MEMNPDVALRWIGVGAASCVLVLLVCAVAYLVASMWLDFRKEAGKR